MQMHIFAPMKFRLVIIAGIELGQPDSLFSIHFDRLHVGIIPLFPAISTLFRWTANYESLISRAFHQKHEACDARHQRGKAREATPLYGRARLACLDSTGKLAAKKHKRHKKNS